ncbi:MAG: hypothetical protein ABW277_24500 [Longimicrobiaceae bacterium]
MSRLALVLLLLSACATVVPDPPAAPPAPDATAAPMASAAAAGIIGEYTVTIAAADIPAEMPDSIRQQMIGTWNIGLHEGNHVLVTYNGREVVSGPYMVSGNQLTLPANDTGPYACRTAATYTWQTSGDQLALTRVQDACDGRAVVLTRHPLMRRG